jgi:hypothetical protein
VLDAIISALAIDYDHAGSNAALVTTYAAGWQARPGDDVTGEEAVTGQFLIGIGIGVAIVVTIITALLVPPIDWLGLFA